MRDPIRIIVAAAVAAAFGLLLCLVASAFAARGATAIAVQATTSRAVYGSDGREHIDYDLVTTNAFTPPAAVEARSSRVFLRSTSPQA